MTHLSGLPCAVAIAAIILLVATAQAEQALVTGIGGFFFRGESPGSLAAWYEEHLGIKRTPTSYDELPWEQSAGPTVFAPFSADTEYFGDQKQQWMINLRVRNMDLLISRLKTAGIEVTEPEVFPNGRFARLQDPEGNPIELWEPAGDAHDTEKR